MVPLLIVVGASLGGFRALEALLGDLPKAFRVPVIIVQHRGKEDDQALGSLLQARCGLPLCEPEDKEAIAPGRVYLAPANYHLLVERGCVALSTDGPVNHARPSVDVLFESAADAYPGSVVAVVLTGAGRDGGRGAAKVKQRGGLLVVQEPATAESGGMPAAALAATRADRVLPLSEIAPFLVGLSEPAESPQNG